MTTNSSRFRHFVLTHSPRIDPGLTSAVAVNSPAARAIYGASAGFSSSAGPYRSAALERCQRWQGRTLSVSGLQCQRRVAHQRTSLAAKYGAGPAAPGWLSGRYQAEALRFTAASLPRSTWISKVPGTPATERFQKT